MFCHKALSQEKETEKQLEYNLHKLKWRNTWQERDSQPSIIASRETLQGSGKLEAGLDWDCVPGCELGLPEIKDNCPLITFNNSAHV